MLANAKDVTILTVELSAEDLNRISKGAMVQSIVCEGSSQSFLLEIYCAFPPGKKLEGRIVYDWD